MFGVLWCLLGKKDMVTTIGRDKLICCLGIPSLPDGVAELPWVPEEHTLHLHFG
jgi:hypothetical protein